MQPKTKFASVDEYLSCFPDAIQTKLDTIRNTIRKAAPMAVEVISYNMPAYKQNGVLVYFAAHKDHIGLYPTASGVREFQKELSPYEFSKGAIQFPLDRRLPVALITRIVKFRVKEDHDKETGKAKRTSKRKPTR